MNLRSLSMLLFFVSLNLSAQNSNLRIPEEIETRFENQCLTLNLIDNSEHLISCKDNLKIQYLMKDCKTDEEIEMAESIALTSCDKNRKNINLHFKTSKNALSIKLAVKKSYEGKKGIITEYDVESINESNLKALSEPKILSNSIPVEQPLKFEFSGFAFVEQERTTNFGSSEGNTTQTALSDFNSHYRDSTANTTSLLSNMNFKLAKDRTQLTSVLELGEIYFGNTASGGGLGGRSNAVYELRNFFITQTMNENMSLDAGLMPLVSDTRGLVFNDHVTAIKLSYTNSWSNTNLWYGQAAAHRPGAAKNRDVYLNLKSELTLGDDYHLGVFALLRDLANESFANTSSVTVPGNSIYRWYGLNFNKEFFNRFTPDFTLIYNDGDFTSQSGTVKDSMSAYLADLKLQYSLKKSGLNFTAESLWTSGEKGSYDSTANAEKLNHRDRFHSTIGATYLLTLATSDGADDSVGSPNRPSLQIQI